VPQLLANSALLFITAVWGATFVTVKDALNDADSFTFLTLRFALGALAAGLLARRHLGDPRVWKNGGTLGVLVFCGYALQTVGLETTSPSRSAFITGLTVLFVPFAARAIARVPPRVAVEPLSKAMLVAIVIAALGLWQLTGVDLAEPFARGDTLTLACAVMYAWHIAATSRLATGVNPLALVCVQLLVTAALALIASCFVERRLHSTPQLWGAVALTGLVASTLAISIQAWAQSHTPAVRAAVIYSLEPVIAVLWAALQGRGLPSLHEGLGGGLVIAAVLVAEVLGSRAKAAANERASVGVLAEGQRAQLDVAQK
jgi:drug/metabolite transporter (DMT)-like permease